MVAGWMRRSVPAGRSNPEDLSKILDTVHWIGDVNNGHTVDPVAWLASPRGPGRLRRRTPECGRSPRRVTSSRTTPPRPAQQTTPRCRTRSMLGTAVETDVGAPCPARILSFDAFGSPFKVLGAC
jgi:hypothetical protein